MISENLSKIDLGNCMTGFLDYVRRKLWTNSIISGSLYTSLYCQLVVMTLKPEEEIRMMEIHEIVESVCWVEGGERF